MVYSRCTKMILGPDEIPFLGPMGRYGEGRVAVNHF